MLTAVMRLLSFWKALIPPAVVPLALWMAVALAGPGGIVEVGDEVEPTFGGTESGETGEDGGGSDGEGGVAGITGEDGGSDVVTGNGGGCEQALTEEAQARAELEGHVADGDKPADGADGNGNALYKQCGGAFDEGPTASTDETATGPGKSEHSSGNTGGGNANGEGQANADDSGNGAADAAGQNKPEKDDKP